MLKANFDKINWRNLSYNPTAIDLLEQWPDKINWESLSQNPAAIDLLERWPDKIYWCGISSNSKAIHLLRANPNKIWWSCISKNSAAIDILCKNPDKINWEGLSQNPSIFVLAKQSIFEGPVDLKEWVWEYPREYLKLDLIRRKLMRAFLDTSYKLCRTRLLREFSRF